MNNLRLAASSALLLATTATLGWAQTTGTTPAPASPADGAADGGLDWLWIIALIAVVAAAAYWFFRRRRKADIGTGTGTGTRRP